MGTGLFMAPRLKYGDTIGIVNPSGVADPIKNARTVRVIESLGFKVKMGANVYRNTYGYVASAQERADDVNAMIADDNVKMVFFGGGESAVDTLPLIDYENIRRHPKLFSSYSDGTNILNAVHAQTGLVTYYGQTPGIFDDLRHYNWTQFESHLIEGNKADTFQSDSEWIILKDGSCEGILLGGYALLFGLLLSNPYFKYDADKRYLLFLEDYAGFSTPGAVNSYITFIEQSALMKQVGGLIVGHFADAPPEALLARLARLGEAHNIPVIYTDDFGHGVKHAIFPIGVKAALDTRTRSMRFVYE